MNTYSKLLNASISEIENYSQTEDGRHFNFQWYEELKKTVLQAANADEDLTAESIFAYITRSIVDSGPLTDKFAPSLYEALDAESRKRMHKQHKNKKP